MGGKFKMEAPSIEPIRVEVKGIDDVLFAIQEYEALLGRYERFAENVLLSCAMPEIPRLVLSNEDDEMLMGNAYEALQMMLVRYRKMSSWFKTNKIDLDSIFGENDKFKS